MIIEFELDGKRYSTDLPYFGKLSKEEIIRYLAYLDLTEDLPVKHWKTKLYINYAYAGGLINHYFYNELNKFQFLPSPYHWEKATQTYYLQPIYTPREALRNVDTTIITYTRECYDNTNTCNMC